MTKADPDDAVNTVEPPEDTARAGVSAKIGGPLGVVLGLGVAAATGVFLTEDGPPPSREAAPPYTIEDAAPTSGQNDPPARPPGLVQPEQLGQPMRPGGMPPPAPEIVVAFNDKSIGKPICDLFWTDKEAAREAFKAFAQSRPYLQGLRLKSVSYSDNFILELEDPRAPVGSSQLRALYGEATTRLRQSPEVKYAEPNSTAQPGKDEQ